jgi:hypothetical protein
MTGRSPKVRRRRLGNELRQLRESAENTIEQVAARREVLDSKISVESARVAKQPVGQVWNGEHLLQSGQTIHGI